MTKRETQRLLKQLNKIETLKAKLATTRDELRCAVEDTDAIIESMNKADEDLECGLDVLKRAVATASEYV